VVPSALLCRWITSLMMNEAEPPGISFGELTVTSVSNSPEAPKTPRQNTHCTLNTNPIDAPGGSPALGALRPAACSDERRARRRLFLSLAISAH
jgi:hypothetical protein